MDPKGIDTMAVREYIKLGLKLTQDEDNSRAHLNYFKTTASGHALTVLHHY